MNNESITRNLNMLYDCLCETILVINTVTRLMDSTSLTSDHRFLLDLHTHIYNTTIRQIDLLYSSAASASTSDSTQDNILHSRAHPQAYSQTWTRRQPQPQPQTQPQTQPQPQTQSLQQPLSSQNINTSNNNRIYINGMPYIIDQIEHISSDDIQMPLPLLSTIRQRPRRQPSERLQNAAQQLIMETLRNFYNPINVVATAAEIANATRNVAFGTIENPSNSTCPISLDRFEENTMVTQLTFCGHVFNPQELTIWLQGNVRCPICRHDIRERAVAGGQSSTPVNSEEEKEDDEEEDETSIPNISERGNPYINIFSRPLNTNSNNNNLNDLANQAFSDLISENTFVFDAIFRPAPPR